jgi:DNA-binding MarR family transcriptional regulator
MDKIKIEDRDYDLWLLIARAHYRVKQARTIELRQYDLSPEQAGVLYYVNYSKNNAKPSDIARWMMREPQTITSNINRMVKKGLIKKTHDSVRKNIIRLSLTEKGKKAYEESIKREAFHRILSALTEEKRLILREALTDLLNAAQKGTDNVIEPSDELI